MKIIGEFIINEVRYYVLKMGKSACVVTEEEYRYIRNCYNKIRRMKLKKRNFV